MSSFGRRRSLVFWRGIFALLAITFLLLGPARARDPWNGALSHLVAAQTATSEAERVQALNAALESLHKTKVPPREAVDRTVQLVETAIADLSRNDDSVTVQDIAAAVAQMEKNLAPRDEDDHMPASPTVIRDSSSGSPFSGKWESISTSGSIIQFQANGTWTEDWKSHHHQGHWQADKDGTTVAIVCDDKAQFHFRLDPKNHLVRDWGWIVYQQVTSAPSAPIAVNDSNATTAAPIASHSTPTVKLPEAQARAIVLVKGDNAEGTGFLVKTKDGPAVITNQHVLANNPNVRITTNTGAELTILSCKGATDRDLAMILIKDGPYDYLKLAGDVSATVQNGDEAITPGNSQGGDVILNTDGKVLGLGPDRIEFDNPIYHGNSGGPVIHVKSGTVIGVVTMAVKVDTNDELNKASFANRNSAIGNSMRYFGVRIDTVPGWETLDPRQFQTETAFLDAFDQRSQAIDSFLNAPDDDKLEDNTWKQDDKIMRANTDFYTQTAGAADTGQKMDALREFWSDLHDIAGTDMAAIQSTSNFYSFDQQRAKDEIAYRRALQAELDKFDKNVSLLTSLPRSNQ